MAKKKLTLKPFFENGDLGHIEASNQDEQDCNACGLHTTCISPKMPVTGKGLKEIFILAEAPGKTEDEENTQLIGDAGKFLRKLLKQRGFDLDEDFWKMNSLSCFISPKVLVYTSDGYKQITKVQVGDLVLTHTGEFCKVLSRTKDRPLSERKNKDLLVDIEINRGGDYNTKITSKCIKFTVTKDHKFLTDNGWIEACLLKEGEIISVLGDKCEECGKVYFKNPQTFDQTQSYCCVECHNKASARKASESGNSSYAMHLQYESGIRVGSEIIKAAHTQNREMIKAGHKFVRSITDEQKQIQYAKIARGRQSSNCCSVWEFGIGYGEKILCEYLSEKQIKYEHQFPIGTKNFDFFLPEFNLLIEIDGNRKYTRTKKIWGKKKLLKNKLAEDNGYALLRVPSTDPITSLERVLKNHRKEFYFTKAKVNKITIRKQKKQEYLYCLEVEKNHSFVALGAVHHNCRPPKNRKPKRKELQLCKKNYMKEIEAKKPKFIWLFGAAAIESFFMDRFKDEDNKFTPTRWRATCIPDPVTNAWVIPMFHPSYAMRFEHDNLIVSQFERDLDFAISCLARRDVPVIDPTQYVEVLTKYEDVVEVLTEFIETPPQKLTFDFETTGLKPFNDGHKIACMSICDNREQSFAFPVQHRCFTEDQQNEIVRLVKILLEKDSFKIAHNCFTGKTKFISEKGLLSFKESCGTKQQVWTTNGWREATIRCFGKDNISRITVVPYNRSRTHIQHEIFTTANHRWKVSRKCFVNKLVQRPVLPEFIQTDQLLIGDCIVAEAPKFNIDINSDAFRHGLIFADGARCSKDRVKKTGLYNHQIRLCGKKEKYKDCFPKYTYPKSANGDPCVNHYSCKLNCKELPPRNATAEYIANFIEGWQLLDGTDSTAGPARVVTTTNQREALWLKANAAVGGWFCTGYSEHLMSATDASFGSKDTPYWMVTLTKGSDVKWTVRAVEHNVSYEETYCAVVPEEESFTLQYGIYTGNCKFEDVWSRWILKAEPGNWHWCSMNAAHILDSRRGFTGLKFQSYVRWGIEAYDTSIAPYLKAKKGQRFNKVMEAPLDELLLYCGCDSLLTFWLYEEQIKEMTEQDRAANDFFLDGLLALSDVQMTGIDTEKEYYVETDEKLGKEIAIIEERLNNSEEAKLFQKETGRPIKLSSDKDLRQLFFDIMKLPITKTTDTELPSVDAETLIALNSDTARDLIAMSKLDKIKNTYCGQFLREIDDDGRLRPFFNLHLVNTFRSSSQGPNFQNIPVRDATAKEYTRSGLFPSRSNILLDWDYSALEVRVIACATQDPKLVKYCCDPTTDMHYDLASKLFKLVRERVSKKLRFHGKNGATFPWFYGSYYKNVAKNVWLACEKEKLQTQDGQDIFDHMCEVGIIKKRNDYDSFEAHIKKVEEWFWEEYKATKAWQENQYKFYEKYGYVETLTGFRFTGYMTRNKLVNYPIQGSAFHCLLYSLIHTNNYIIDNGLDSRILGQIHDCLLFDVVPSEREQLLKATHEIACNQIRRDWKWIIVPLDIEVEETEVDCSWFSKVETREEEGFYEMEEED